MKDLFKSYYKFNKEDFKTLWSNAIFVFDTNVLLNLYRYRSTTRESLFDVFENLTGRIWIPYHVGLEFQRNRLYVIAEQNKKYTDVRSIVNKSLEDIRIELEQLQLKKRHSHIDPDKLIKDMNEIKDKFFIELDELNEKSIDITSDDYIRERIDSLFGNCIGDPPLNQKELDDFFEEGLKRYKFKIPPGYEDSSKANKTADEFTYAGLIYKRKFGDLLVWKQIIKHASQKDIKDLIFVTDDSKTDWWWKIDSNGTKTIGARPELSDELIRETSIERFYMYNTESFLYYSNKQLGSNVDKEAIEEVREISRAKRIITDINKYLHNNALSAERIVREWLSNRFQEVEENRGFPDFTCYINNNKYGFEVKYIREIPLIIYRLRDIIFQAYYQLKENKFNEITIVIVVPDKQVALEAVPSIKKNISTLKSGIKIIIGTADINETNGELYNFQPFYEIY